MNTPNFSDMYRLERNKALAKQTEVLRGLTFTILGGAPAEFIVFTTEISNRGDTQITGVCTDPFPDTRPTAEFNFIQGQVYKFGLAQVIFSGAAYELRRAFGVTTINTGPSTAQVL
tara:strand:+ start:200 stop:547 length:348 start_codon:yes stop_codon:yes gene_type:complete